MTYHAQNEAMLARFGYRPSGAPVCPLVVAGKRCRAYREGHEKCLCQRYHDLFGHGRVWITATGGHALTGEPYGLEHYQELYRAFVVEAAALGLSVTLSDESPWNPGHTTLIRVEAGTKDT